jgi:Ni2+-binding GTPase involved in maturation of urease and hydrogenase
MKLVTVSGAPSSGKTSVILKTIEHLQKQSCSVGVVKFDCLHTDDDKTYKRAGIPVLKGLSGELCPDHFFITNIKEAVGWGETHELDLLISESAGLCNRCSPHIKGILSICVIDQLSGVHTPRKIGPMLRMADIIVITKGDIVSQAEREVFTMHVKYANPRGRILYVNGLTGQGAFELVRLIQQEANPETQLEGEKLRFPMPMAICSYCLGETRIGEQYQSGNMRKIGGIDEA